MKYLKFKLVALLFFINSGTDYAQVSEYELINHFKLSENVLVVRAGEVYPDQVVAISTKKGIVLIDAGISPTLSKEYRKTIEQQFEGKEIKYVVNTHHHFDHTNGNQVFSDATIIAHTNCGMQMDKFVKNIPHFVKSRKERYIRRGKLAQSLDTNTQIYKRLGDLVFTSEMMCMDFENHFKLTKPNLTFKDKLTLDLGNITLELYYFGKGFHTNNDIIAFIPEEGLVFTGDVFQAHETNTYVNSNCEFGRAIHVLDAILNSGIDLKYLVTIHAGLLNPDKLISARKNFKNILTNINTKESATIVIDEVINKEGIDAAMNKFKEMRSDTAQYYFLEGDFNELGEKLLDNKKYNEAIAIFEMNKMILPESADVFDWLGYAYMTAGKDEKAIKAFKKALSINPVNSYALDMISIMENSMNE